MNSLEQFNVFVKARGRWLMEELGWDLWLLSKSDALEALAILDSEPAMILGGDAFFQDSDGRPTYGVSMGHMDSFWRFEKRPEESFVAACARSKPEARRFIEAFPEDAEGFVGIEFSACDSDGHQRIRELKIERGAELRLFVDRLKSKHATNGGI